MTSKAASAQDDRLVGAVPVTWQQGGFVWGAATASYQVEGAVSEGGRGASIWDVFSHTPGKTLDGDTGDVAVDHYHRWASDLDLAAQLGIQAYRFSIAWPRVIPTGRGPVNTQGLDFYDRLVDGLLERGITPAPTLYHWDLPQTLEDAGGWPVRDTAYAFADYAAAVVDRLRDRVTLWGTLNEPWCTAFLGYAAGVHAPGRTSPGDSLAAAHHLNLAHGLASRIIRERVPDAVVTIALNVHALRPASEAAEDREAVRRIDAVGNRIFLDPIMLGRYPDELLRDTASITDGGFVRDGDLDVCCAPPDWLGLNYYTTNTVRAARGEAVERADGHGGGASPWPGADNVEFLAVDGPRTDMGWLIDPSGLTETLVRLDRDYGRPLVILENGSAWPDTVDADGAINDAERVAYLDAHVQAVLDARASGVDVRGYFAWSLLDNFEWAYGYRKRFGLIHVDYATQQRTIKQSGHRYAQIIARWAK